MVGYPKTLNTKDDYEFVKNNFPKDMWKDDFQDLLDTRYDWFNEGEVSGEGVSDDTHKIVEDTEANKKYQYVYKENMNCLMYQLGYTADEVESILASK